VPVDDGIVRRGQVDPSQRLGGKAQPGGQTYLFKN